MERNMVWNIWRILWLQSGEIAFAVTENFVEPTWKYDDYKRHEDLQERQFKDYPI